MKSPTYTLVEPYEVGRRAVYHFDLYRLTDAEELDYLGIRDYLASDAISLVEWPERGADALPAADLEVHLIYLDGARQARLRANTGRGAQLLERLS